MSIIFGKKPLLTALFFTAAIAAIAFFTIVPAIADIENVGERIREQKDNIAGYEKKVIAAREFAVFQKDQKANMERVGSVFVDAKMPLDFINSLENLARDCSVKIEFSSSVQQQQKAANEPQSISIEADISGGLPELLMFLKKIENSPYLVQVQTANILIVEPKAVEHVIIENASTTEAIRPVETKVDQVKAHVLLKAYAK